MNKWFACRMQIYTNKTDGAEGEEPAQSVCRVSRNVLKMSLRGTPGILPPAMGLAAAPAYTEARARIPAVQLPCG